MLSNGSVTNQGTISGAAGQTANSYGLFGVGGRGGGGVTMSGGSLTNTTLATIIGGAGARGRGATGATGSDGIVATVGSIFNQGIIIGGAGGAVTGSYHDVGGAGISLDGGIVTNLNTIGGGIGHGDSGLGGFGVYVLAGTLIDAGVIDGGFGTNSGGTIVTADAVSFGGAGRLVLYPGASFSGAVAGNAVLTDVLELASGGAGSLAGLGSSITNFASLVFDAGAQWTVAGNASASGLGTFNISGFTVGDTIDLTGFGATSETFASNMLVLSNSGGTHETLHIQGSLVSGNFTLSAVGTTTTGISFGAAPLSYGQTIDEAGLIVASETVAAGVMTLFNGGTTAVGSINVGTSLSTGDFILTSDGTGGTDVIVNAVFGTYTSGLTLLVNPTTIQQRPDHRHGRHQCGQ